VGSTGARTNTSGFSIGSSSGETFGVKGAAQFNGSLPLSSGLTRHSDSDIQLAVGTGKLKNIIFQFKLNDKGNKMLIHAYDPNTGKKANVAVSATAPSISKVQKDGSSAEKAQATRMQDLMNKSTSGISEASLSSIAGELLARRRKK
jgi:hypothetical protein